MDQRINLGEQKQADRLGILGQHVELRYLVPFIPIFNAERLETRTGFRKGGQFPD
ncbi:hypothetical protein D3C71_2004130 [compost metagenome]